MESGVCVSGTTFHYGRDEGSGLDPRNPICLIAHCYVKGTPHEGPSVTPGPETETGCTAEAAAGGGFLLSLGLSAANGAAGAGASRKAVLRFFTALLIFLDKTAVLGPGICDEMQEEGRIVLGFEKDTRTPERN